MKNSSWTNPIIRLSFFAFLLIACYLVLSWRFPLLLSLSDHRATWFSMSGGSIPWLGVQIGLYLVLTISYIGSIRTLINIPDTDAVPNKESNNHSRWLQLLIGITWLVSSVILMLTAPAGESHDIFDYVFRGRMMVESGANPLTEVPKEYRKTAYFRFVAWHSNVDTYGPLWEFTSAGISRMTLWEAGILGWWLDDEPVCPDGKDSDPVFVANSCRLLSLYLTNYRLVAVLLSGITGLLIGSIVTKSIHGKRPDMCVDASISFPQRQQKNILPLAAVWVWLLNPLTLIASAVGAHNDFLMLVILILAVWLVHRRKIFLGLVTLILAAHVKLTALIWVPVFAAWVWVKWGWKRFLLEIPSAAIFGFVLSWLLYRPFGGWSSLPQMLEERSRYLANSTWRVIYAYLHLHRGLDRELVRWFTVSLPNILFLILVILVCAWLVNMLPRRWLRVEKAELQDERRFWYALALTWLIYLVSGAYWFQHWYILWVLAPAALLPASMLTSKLLPWLSFGALAGNLVDNYMFSSLPKSTPKFIIHTITLVVIWLPFLFVIITLVLRKGKKKPSKNSK